MCDLHICWNSFATRHGRFHPSVRSLYFLNTAQSCLRLPDLLYPPAFFIRPPGIPTARFRFASCQLIEAAVILAYYFIPFEFLPPEPGPKTSATACEARTTPDSPRPPRSGFYSYYQSWQRAKRVTLLASILRWSAAATDAPDLFPFILFEAHAN